MGESIITSPYAHTGKWRHLNHTLLTPADSVQGVGVLWEEKQQRYYAFHFPSYSSLIYLPLLQRVNPCSTYSKIDHDNSFLRVTLERLQSTSMHLPIFAHLDVT